MLITDDVPIQTIRQVPKYPAVMRYAPSAAPPQPAPRQYASEAWLIGIGAIALFWQHDLDCKLLIASSPSPTASSPAPQPLNRGFPAAYLVDTAATAKVQPTALLTPQAADGTAELQPAVPLNGTGA